LRQVSGTLTLCRKSGPIPRVQLVSLANVSANLRLWSGPPIAQDPGRRAVLTAFRQCLISEIAVALGVAAGYFAICGLGLSLDVTAGVSSVWPASGLLTGLLLVVPRERWPAVAGGALLGGIAANLTFGFAAMVSVGYTLISLAESWAVAVAVRRVTPEAIRLRHPADVLSLTAFCASAATIGAVFAATLASAALHAHFWTALQTWIAADVSGMVTIGPVVLAMVPRTDSGIPWTVRRSVEWALMLIVLSASSWWIFFSPHTSVQTPLTQPFPLLPLAIWAAVRFGVPGTIWSLLIVNSLCLWGTSLGFGPYATGYPLQAHLTVQLFSCAVSLLFLVLATSVESTQRSVRLHRELALQVQSAADAERSRLAHELHDDIAQKLAALKMQLELDSLIGQNGRSTEEFVGVVDHLISDVRALSRSMRPAPFEEGQLIPALATLARTEGQRAGLRVLVDARVDELHLTRDVELACYRVVREAVTNIIKHARAHHLAVSALTHAGVFAVRVVDDGRGFDVVPAARKAALDGHLGLIGMQERLDQVGGTLKISSRRGGGTMIECRVPLMTGV
jgi:signal transduction histidine kinase